MPRTPRRFLLSADPDRRIYLDLRTGAEVVEPAPKPVMSKSRRTPPPPPPAPEPGLLLSQVSSCLDALEVVHSTGDDGILRIHFSGQLLSPFIVIIVDEEDRALRMRLDLQVLVPPKRQRDFLEAVTRLNANCSAAQLLMDPEDGRLGLYHAVFLGDVEPTPAMMEAQIAVMMRWSSTMHWALGSLALGLVDTVAVETFAQYVDDRLQQAWASDGDASPP